MMIRSTPRSLLRSSSGLSHIYRSPQTRRFLSTAPPAQKSRSWRNSAARWGIAAAGIYFYNTSPVFADNPALLEAPPFHPNSPTDETDLSTLESIASARNLSSKSQPPSPQMTTTTPPETDLSTTESSASQQGAFNEETGEINWDCPCLGGMAHGPCGEQFRTAFSCFVYSGAEPKGMDCIEHFKGMQDCFREYPDVYGGELADDDVAEEVERQEKEREEGAEPATRGLARTSTADTNTSGNGPEENAKPAITTAPPAPINPSTEDTSPQAKTSRAKEATAQVRRDHDHEPLSETDELVPKAAHDATTAHEGK